MIKLAKAPVHGLGAGGVMLEGEIKRDILSALARVDGIRMAINANGVTKDERGNTFTYGLGPGSADLVGIATSHMHRRVADMPHGAAFEPVTVGRVVGIEVKKPGGSTTAKRKRMQDAWIATVKRLGGIAGYARSVEDALALVEGEGFDVTAARAWWQATEARRSRR
jgi:hypothetical protein